VDVSYEELKRREWLSPFGGDDVRGCLNRLSPAASKAAAGLVQTGRSFDLTATLDWPDPPIYGRKAVKQTVFDNEFSRDDYLDDYHPQLSSQWDALRHVKDAASGHFFNRKEEEELGTDTWPPIVTRGILADVAGHAAAKGRPIDWRDNYEISLVELEECLQEAEITPQMGDVLLIRTGWETGYRGASDQVKRELADTPNPDLRTPGLQPSEELAARLWDWGLVAVAADNPSLEVWPPPAAEPDVMHFKMLGRMGMPIGELFWLEDLARYCAEVGRHSFLFTSAVLKLHGLCGTPPNAIAVL